MYLTPSQAVHVSHSLSPSLSLSLCAWKIPASLTKQSVHNCYFQKGVSRINGHRLRFSIAKDQRLSSFSVDTIKDECHVLFVYIYTRMYARPRAHARTHARTHAHTHTTTFYPIHLSLPLSLSLSHQRNFQGTIHVPPWYLFWPLRSQFLYVRNTHTKNA